MIFIIGKKVIQSMTFFCFFFMIGIINMAYAEDVYQITNFWKKGYQIKDGSAADSLIESSTNWIIEPVHGTKYFSIRNLATRNYITVQNNAVSIGPLRHPVRRENGAMWELSPVGSLEYTFRIKNRANGTYLNIETGTLTASAVPYSFNSSYWKIISPGGVGYSTDQGIWVITDVVISAKPVDTASSSSQWHGYIPLTENNVAYPAPKNPTTTPNAYIAPGQPANVTTGIGGRDVWLYVKYEEYVHGGADNPDNIVVDIDVRSWNTTKKGAKYNKYWKMPRELTDANFKPARVNGPEIFPGSLSPGTKHDCLQMGLALRTMSPEDAYNQDGSFVSNIALAVTDNKTPQLPGGLGWLGFPDLHTKCGDKKAYNIFVKTDKIRNPSPIRPNLTDAKKVDLAEKHLPYAHLAIGEEYGPSSIAFHLQHTKHRDIKGNKYSLETKTALKTPSSLLPWFNGQTPDKAQVISFFVEKGFGMEITYFYFYPYNKGKKPAATGKGRYTEIVGSSTAAGLLHAMGYTFAGVGVGAGIVVASETVWGNHVGDWEHATVRLKWVDDAVNGWQLEPYQVYAAAHDHGHTLNWPMVHKHGDTHPVLYIAKGSHGMYFQPDRVQYRELPPLFDEPSVGAVFHNPANLVVFDLPRRKDLRTGATWPKENFLESIERWGNGVNGYQSKDPNCLGSLVCRLENGPTGPLEKKQVFRSFALEN